MKKDESLFLLDQKNIVRLPHEDLDEWCARYELTVFEGMCGKCEAKLMVNIPWASGTWRGLISEKCQCGEGKFLPCTMVNIEKNHPLNILGFGVR